MARRTWTLLAGAAALGGSGCASEEGGGPLGFVAFDKNHHVSAAEPLFGKDEDRCLDSPQFLLALYAEAAVPGSGATHLGDGELRRIAACRQVMGAIRAAMDFGSFEGPGAATGSPRTAEPYSDRQRNEVIDALMAASNRKCSRYIAFLQQYDANINSTLGIAAQAAAIIASVASGGTAQGFAAASGIAGGARGTLNNAHFQNQTIAVLTNAFENSRAEQRLEISRRQQCAPARYTMMRGLEDAFRYHGSCSIVFGLKQTQRAVEEAAAPNMESFNRMLDQLAAAQAKMKALSGGEAGAGEAGGGQGASDPPAAADAGGGAGAGGAAGGGGGGAGTGGSQGVTDPPGGAASAPASANCPFDPPAAATPKAPAPPAARPAAGTARRNHGRG